VNKLQASFETWQGEGLKTAAENTLHLLGSSAIGQKIIEHYAFGSEGRVADPALHTEVAGIEFENPILFGAGWDKKGRAIHGLYHLGFSGGDVGTVLPFMQVGNPKPRLWTVDKDHSVGLNRLGFNSPGMTIVEQNLKEAEPLPIPIGINVGRNKEISNNDAAWAHEQVIRTLGKYASYIVLGISSPNSKDVRKLQDKEYLRELIQRGYAAMEYPVPLFIKIDGERSFWQLDDMIRIAVEEALSGMIAINTYSQSDLKEAYGKRWAKETGGLSGNDPRYRDLATATVRHIYEAAGDKLAIIGVGGVNDTNSALEKIKAGASAVQVVTAIRETRGKVAANINRRLLEYMQREGVGNIQELVGIDTARAA